MTRQPVLFISHGSPNLAVHDTSAHCFLKTFAADLPRPRALLVLSAHWETSDVRVGAATAPATIYDFGAFDPRLRDITYPAPAALDVAEAARAALEANGVSVIRDPANGYDHGVWVPLYLLYPDADLPIAQISIQPNRDPAHHYGIGQALQPLRDDGVMIVASGAMTHNLRAFFGKEVDADAPEWVTTFNDWFVEKLATRDLAALLDYRKQAPFAEKNHPTDEHLLPVFSALGAAYDDEPGKRVHASYEHGVLAMDVYQFG